MTRRGAGLGIVFATLVAVAPACGVSGLSFVKDNRVDIVRPEDRADVRLPVTVDWTVEDFAVGPGKGSFGVFVDRAPQKSGERLSWVFRGDDACKGSEGRSFCSSDDFLNERFVFETTDTAITLDRIPDRTGDDRRREFHEVTVILMDEDGRRVGEGAWAVQFAIEDED